RESKCPPIRNCAGPSGYGWDSWKADFFQPAQPLFQIAPWIMVRGNHEDCEKRAGEGWFRFLDHKPEPLPKECSGLTEPFVIKEGGLSFVAADNARADKPKHDCGEEKEEEKRLIEKLSAQFRETVRKIENITPKEDPSWLLSHRPFHAIRYDRKDGY